VFKSKFVIVNKEGKARTGKLVTSRGEVSTPVFLPVGTQASVKAVDSLDLIELNCEMILANTYHLYLQPGGEVLAKLGGIHKFMNWDKPILTDSGGFQVFSLGFGIEHQVGKIVNLYGDNIVMGENLTEQKEVVVRTKQCKVEEEGPTFQSYIDGSVHFFPPEKSVQTQEQIGADFVVAMDECTSPLHDYDYTKVSMERSHRWEERSLYELNKIKSERENNQEMFGVVQGGPFEDLRIESAKFVSDNDFFGVGIGGALVSQEKMCEIMDWIHPHLDDLKPRHLLGIGTVRDIFLGVARGIDIFDCVHPTRVARYGIILHKKSMKDDERYAKAYNVRTFAYDISKAVFTTDESPLEEGCTCFTCRHYTRAYLKHLFKAHELIAFRLASIHNVHFMLRLMEEIREAINEKRFAKLVKDWLE
jgi:queuine tRNA-ribosyltransferase/7-cyano-7-deazaguanine tRNA-ribosyltransferase